MWQCLRHRAIRVVANNALRVDPVGYGNRPHVRTHMHTVTLGGPRAFERNDGAPPSSLSELNHEQSVVLLHMLHMHVMGRSQQWYLTIKEGVVCVRYPSSPRFLD